jgi:hypothetical protein
MIDVSFAFRRHLSRRTFLSGAGVAIALPWLDAMTPAFANAAAQIPRRFVAISNALGFSWSLSVS